MSVPIFWRFILGSAALLVLSIAACLYSIVQLSTLSATAREALDHDHRMIDFQEALTDTFLSEVRYGGKYIISRKEDRHEQLLQFKHDFARHLDELRARTRSDKMIGSLSKIEEIHRQYHKLFDQEVAYIRSNQPYAQSRYEQERDKLLESGLHELERLKLALRASLHAKLEGMEQSARTARAITITTTAIVVLLGIFLSMKVMRGIRTPLKERELRTEGDTIKTAAG